jgi:hypothetical protein
MMFMVVETFRNQDAKRPDEERRENSAIRR